MTGRQKNRPSCGMTSDFRSICGIDPVMGIGLVEGPTLVVSLTHVYKINSFSITEKFVAAILVTIIVLYSA